MKTLFSRALAAVCPAILLLLAGSGAGAQTLPNGNYRCTAEFGAVLLDGRYPFEVNGFPAGTLEVSVTPTGAINATVSAFGEVEDATGQIRVRTDSIRLTLKGRVDDGRIRVNAMLQGSAFVGTATILGRSGPCRIDVTGIGPIHAEYDLALTSSAQGRITGSGMLTVDREAIPVAAAGSVQRGKVALTLKGGNTFLKTKAGELSANGFTARKWTGQGFGALIKGRNLAVRLE